MTFSPMSKLPIFCDYLDVTYSPTDCPYPDLNLRLLDANFDVSRDASGSILYVPPTGFHGMLKVLHCARFAKISISGGVCAALRQLGIFEEVLWVLSTSPHKVTRLDAALDLPLDAADVLDGLCIRYPTGQVNLGRKALSVTRMVSTRADGRESGTYYVGHRTAARFTARVYDKALETLQKRGIQIQPTTRVEVTARKDSGVTLRDAAVPESIFWHIASPALLKRPEGVAMWSPNQDSVWSSVKRPFEPSELLQRRVNGSAELEALIGVADSMGAYGRDYLLSLIAKRLARVSSDEESAA